MVLPASDHGGGAWSMTFWTVSVARPVAVPRTEELRALARLSGATQGPMCRHVRL